MLVSCGLQAPLNVTKFGRLVDHISTYWDKSMGQSDSRVKKKKPKYLARILSHKIK